ncbi:ATP-binding protein [Flavobacterium sp. UBA7680]|uniref:ATP-binding protein n=1 Tax=Flavobacterium sp. UBA7680 TaxID=1946559 RepID=UPI0025BD8B7A|nr:ATP-binding protein [Flavobacterium sp. UBA7680]
MINTFKKGNKSYNLYDNNYHKNQNIFTVIVGKNGTGKSRLLNDIISNFVPVREGRHVDIVVSYKEKLNPKIDLEFSKTPDKIIAVSTSPYDKFPLPPIFGPINLENEYYSYIGIRDLRTTNFSMGFMSKIIGQLLYIRSIDSYHFSKIIEVLNYLGYSEELHIAIDFRILRSQIQLLLNSDDPEKDFLNIFLRTNNLHRPYSSFFKNEDDSLNIERLNRLLSILDQIKEKRKTVYNLILNSTIIDSELKIDDILFLIEAGIVKLRDVGLRKLNTDNIYKISEASSGEQCIFTTLIGISCNIADNSLILIDEPEISLHPEWQERYITLLIETFQNFKNCHFIIATHSPQLISKLSIENCYILQMDTKELKNAKYYANNSIDFQLANVFNSPGFKNEYLSRIAFSIISKVGKNKKFDEDDLKNYQLIKSQIKFLQENDPIVHLYNLIKDLKK